MRPNKLVLADVPPSMNDLWTVPYCAGELKVCVGADATCNADLASSGYVYHPMKGGVSAGCPRAQHYTLPGPTSVLVVLAVAIAGIMFLWNRRRKTTQ
jgi:hypothetical protein